MVVSEKVKFKKWVEKVFMPSDIKTAERIVSIYVAYRKLVSNHEDAMRLTIAHLELMKQ